MSWHEIDHEMVRHKLSLIAQEMQPRVVSEERRALFKCRQTGNKGVIKPSLVDLHVRLTDEWVDRTYQAYCEVWTAQGRAKTSSFIRDVFKNALAPLIAMRDGVISAHFRLMATRKREKSYGSEYDSLARRLNQLRGKWFDKLEIEARTCDHSDQSPSRPQIAQRSEPLGTLQGQTVSQQPDQNSVPGEDPPPLMPPQKPNYVSVWEEIDQTLVRLKLQEPLERHIEDVAEERQTIEYEHRENRHAMVEALLKMVERRADEWIGIEYQVQCEVWKLQGQSVTADFLRTLRDNIVEPTIRARTSAERSHLIMMWNRCGFPGQQTLESQLTSFKRTMMRLEHRWKTRLEIRAKEWEHAGKLSRSEAEQIDPRRKVARSRSPRAEKKKQSRRTGSHAELKYRSELKRAILIQLTKKPDATDLEICRALDADGAIDVPAGWSARKDRLFASVYMNRATRGNVQTVISKVRADLRKIGFLD